MNKKYRMPAVLLLVCLLSSICLCGCRRGPKFSVDDTLKHLKDRYGEKFSYVEDYDAHQPSGGGYEFYVSCEKIPNQKIYVKVIRDGQGFRYADNYLAAKYYTETEAALREMAQAVYGSDAHLVFKLTKGMDIADSDVDPGITLEQFWTTKQAGLSCCLKIAPGHGIANKDAELDALEKLIKEKKMHVRFSIYYVTNDTAYTNDSTSLSYKDFEEHALLSIGEDFKTTSKTWDE